MTIAPAILVSTYDELGRQIKKVENLFAYVQLDIMDGKFVPGKSFNHNQDKNLEEYLAGLKTDLQYELHLMVDDPLAELEQWQNVKNVFRVIFHLESQADPAEVIAKIRGNCWQAGLAINPDTPISKLEPYLDKINMVLFMTVYPGKQGAAFLPEMEDKITAFARIPDHPAIAVDGGVNSQTIKQIKSWGVEIFNVGSALMMKDDVKQALTELQNLIK